MNARIRGFHPQCAAARLVCLVESKLRPPDKECHAIIKIDKNPAATVSGLVVENFVDNKIHKLERMIILVIASVADIHKSTASGFARPVLNHVVGNKHDLGALGVA